VALSHYCCRTTLQCQCHETVLELSGINSHPINPTAALRVRLNIRTEPS